MSTTVILSVVGLLAAYEGHFSIFMACYAYSIGWLFWRLTQISNNNFVIVGLVSCMGPIGYLFAKNFWNIVFYGATRLP